MEETKGIEGGDWTRVEVDLQTIDWRGEPLTLHRVRAERNSATGKLRIDPEDAAQAEMLGIADRHGVSGRDLPLMLMLVAKPGPFKAGQISTKYRLNKMLFLQWKRLIAEGLGDSFPRDDFVSARAGPVPRYLKEDMERLQREGFLKIQWGKRPGESTEVELTPKGLAAATQLWRAVPEVYREITQKVKEELFPLSPQTIKEKFHAEYPEFHRTYLEVDTE